MSKVKIIYSWNYTQSSFMLSIDENIQIFNSTVLCSIPYIPDENRQEVIRYISDQIWSILKSSAFNETIKYIRPSKSFKLQTSLNLLIPRLNSWLKNIGPHATKAFLVCHSTIVWTNVSWVPEDIDVQKAARNWAQMAMPRAANGVWPLIIHRKPSFWIGWLVFPL